MKSTSKNLYPVGTGNVGKGIIDRLSWCKSKRKKNGPGRRQGPRTASTEVNCEMGLPLLRELSPMPSYIKDWRESKNTKYPNICAHPRNTDITTLSYRQHFQFHFDLNMKRSQIVEKWRCAMNSLVASSFRASWYSNKNIGLWAMHWWETWESTEDGVHVCTTYWRLEKSLSAVRESVDRTLVLCKP